jgi:hypothetical protein
MKTFADCKRVSEQSAFKPRNRIVRHRSVDFAAHHPYSATPSGWTLTPGRFTVIHSA